MIEVGTKVMVSLDVKPIDAEDDVLEYAGLIGRVYCLDSFEDDPFPITVKFDGVLKLGFFREDELEVVA